MVLKVSSDGIIFSDLNMGLSVCDKHSDTTTLDDIITDEGWARIRMEFFKRGKAMPERKHTQLTMVPWKKGAKNG